MQFVYLSCQFASLLCPPHPCGHDGTYGTVAAFDVLITGRCYWKTIQTNIKYDL